LNRRPILTDPKDPAHKFQLHLISHEACAAHEPPVEMIGASAAFRNLVKQLKDAARWDRDPVLLTGERGSGKDAGARALHMWSPRRRERFVPVLTPALSGDLLADELFGHKRHSYTGAMNARSGKFVTADRGTLFLDEISSLDLKAQSVLLRVLERGEMSAIGEDLPRTLDVRIIAATHGGSRRCRNAVLAAIFLMLLPSLKPAMAQKAGSKAGPVVTIDGAVEPDRIPDWILWRELLSVAAMLAERARDGGRDIWMNRLGLSEDQMNQIVAHGRSLGDEEKLIDREVKDIIAASGNPQDGPTRSRLHQIHADKESRVLVRRDLLRKGIGADAVLRLQAFARLHIAPTVKVGTMAAEGK
jgi:Sigma-54 interaction domain